MYVSAVAEARGVTRDAIYKVLYRAYKNLRAAGITPPANKQDAGTTKKCNGPTPRVVNLGYIDEIAEG